MNCKVAKAISMGLASRRDNPQTPRKYRKNKKKRNGRKLGDLRMKNFEHRIRNWKCIFQQIFPKKIWKIFQKSRGSVSRTPTIATLFWIFFVKNYHMGLKIFLKNEGLPIEIGLRKMNFFEIFKNCIFKIIKRILAEFIENSFKVRMFSSFCCFFYRVSEYMYLLLSISNRYKTTLIQN